MKTTYPILDPHAPKASRAVPPAGTCALAMMIKAPRPGASKTRLSPPLTPLEAAAISTCFLQDTTANIAQTIIAAGDRQHPAAGIAVYTPVGLESAFAGLLPMGFCLVAQRGELFGDRLIHALEDLLALGYGAVCLIDSDSPTLPAESLRLAVDALARPGDRMVLGPSEDGGYYLIGLKHAHRRLFEDIDWSTERVAAQTLARAAELGLEVVALPTWYDVDDAATLRMLCDELLGLSDELAGLEGVRGYGAPRTREFLSAILAAEGHGRIWPEADVREPTPPAAILE
jgi:rSAM/selenodomain-associated transferase 1